MLTCVSLTGPARMVLNAAGPFKELSRSLVSWLDLEFLEVLLSIAGDIMQPQRFVLIGSGAVGVEFTVVMEDE